MKVNLGELLDLVQKSPYVISKSLDMFTISDINNIAKLSKDSDILVTISYESNNMYSKTMINMVKKSVIESSDDLLKIL